MKTKEDTEIRRFWNTHFSLENLSFNLSLPLTNGVILNFPDPVSHLAYKIKMPFHKLIVVPTGRQLDGNTTW